MCFLKTYFPPLNILQIFRTLYEPILQHIILAAQIAQIHHIAMGIFLRKKRKLCSDACPAPSADGRAGGSAESHAVVDMLRKMLLVSPLFFGRLRHDIRYLATQRKAAGY